MPVALYDSLSSDYDRFVNWKNRLAYELPFIQARLKAAQALRILDAACGTGMHAIALQQQGYEVTGADLSASMIERARANALAAGSQARFAVAGFGELTTQVGGGFDALLCLGNSLPHVLTPAELHEALADFHAMLRPGGLLMLQSRNFDWVLDRRERWMSPESHREGEKEWLFTRFYDFDPDGLLTFNVITTQREGAVPWRQQVSATRLWPQCQAELAEALRAAGFASPGYYGDMQGAAFVAERSPNLIITAQRAA
jgi:glycine/sarcosine N-methyltransferase